MVSFWVPPRHLLKCIIRLGPLCPFISSQLKYFPPWITRIIVSTPFGVSYIPELQPREQGLPKFFWSASLTTQNHFTPYASYALLVDKVHAESINIQKTKPPNHATEAILSIKIAIRITHRKRFISCFCKRCYLLFVESQSNRLIFTIRIKIWVISCWV